MALRRTLVLMCLSLAVTAAWGCKRSRDEPAPTNTRGAMPPAPSAAPEPQPAPEPEPAPQAAKPPAPPAPPPPIEEPVDDRPEWQKVLDSQEPGALMGRRRQPSQSASGGPASEAVTDDKPAGEAANKPPAPAAKPEPTGKGKTYCTWQYYAKIQYMCTDLEPAAAKEKCEKAESARLGEPVICMCVPAEGYAPQCL